MKTIPLNDFLRYVDSLEIPLYPPDDSFKDIPSAATNSFKNHWDARKKCNNKGMWPIVDRRWTKKLSNWIGNKKCLEIMAGGGWISKALNNHGIDIIATDNFSWEKTHKDMKLLCDVLKKDAAEAAAYYKDRDILVVSWPPFNQNDICDACNAWGVDRPIIYIGEGEGGCNAPEGFWEHFKELDNQPKIPLARWAGINDRVIIGYWTWEKLHI